MKNFLWTKCIVQAFRNFSFVSLILLVGCQRSNVDEFPNLELVIWGEFQGEKVRILADDELWFSGHVSTSVTTGKAATLFIDANEHQPIQIEISLPIFDVSDEIEILPNSSNYVGVFFDRNLKDLSALEMKR